VKEKARDTKIKIKNTQIEQAEYHTNIWWQDKNRSMYFIERAIIKGPKL
jgi:hypothetical protein